MLEKTEGGDPYSSREDIVDESWDEITRSLKQQHDIFSSVETSQSWLAWGHIKGAPPTFEMEGNLHSVEYCERMSWPRYMLALSLHVSSWQTAAQFP
jgi:hypothetical protein